MRILSILNDNEEYIQRNKITVRVILNEFEKDKYDLLRKNLESLHKKELYEIEIHNNNFIKVFNECYPSMKQSANFLFLDQNGIKQITEDVFSKLIGLQQTDFLFYISSFYIKRFGEVEEFKKYLNITKQDLEGKSYFHIHRIVLTYYRSLIPKLKNYFLAPFSIKKPSGVYGLIFGSNHTYGLEKFLHVCWKHDKLTGEANFDIDNETRNEIPLSPSYRPFYCCDGFFICWLCLGFKFSHQQKNMDKFLCNTYNRNGNCDFSYIDLCYRNKKDPWLVDPFF
jgi:three-Cys-motif partner protein